MIAVESVALELDWEIITLEQTIRECEEEMHRLVYRLYGLTDEEIGVIEGER